MLGTFRTIAKKKKKERKKTGNKALRAHFPYNVPIERMESIGSSLVVQLLVLHTSTAGGLGLIPGRGTNIPQDARHHQIKKRMGRITFKNINQNKILV